MRFSQEVMFADLIKIANNDAFDAETKGAQLAMFTQNHYARAVDQGIVSHDAVMALIDADKPVDQPAE